MADQWANPLFATALITSRDGTMSPDDHASVIRGNGEPPALNDPRQLVRWDPWVRINVAVTELLRDVHFEPRAPDTGVLSCTDDNGQTRMLATMDRPDRAFFEQQIELVQSWAELRDERLAEILAQIDNPYAFLAAASSLHVQRKPWTMEWLTVVVQFTISVELLFKHAFACFRPVEFSPQVQPIVSTPGHGTYPMGHAAQAFATVVALAALVKKHPDQTNAIHPLWTQLYRQARRISVNRVVCGVHFPTDAASGQVLGLTLGEYFVCRSGLGSVRCVPRSFVPDRAIGGADDRNDYLGDGPMQPHGCTAEAPLDAIGESPYLGELARLAGTEWQV